MDRSAQLRVLAATKPHIASGIKHISDQVLLIADRDFRGEDSTLARSLLKTFCVMQVQHIAHRDRILRELAQ
jgi:hypothetical protein